ncbi:MAG TPA: phosphoglucosamine mutase [Candidatus Altiarchaeales archaeon]|nr:phosphoglucosamine mutase [Candidatus Altiarchaeales archaeon]
MFGTSGIRRLVSELSGDFVLELGKSLGTFVDVDTIAVGLDTRASGPRMRDLIAEGITSTGKNVLDIGVCTTPTLGVATADLGFGVMVTASHNPPEYNGFKFFDRNGAFRPSQEKEIQKIFESKKFLNGVDGKVSRKDYVSKHIELILENVGRAEGVKVLVDCAGGAGSTITPRLLEEMGCKVTAINTGRDGVFPHPLEPTAKNLEKTREIVREGDFDIAFAHDGDADRACAIDKYGNLVDWDNFLTLLAWGRDTVVTTVDASIRIKEFCKKVVVVPVGDVAVAEGIRENNADFGGEPSGTYIFPEIHMYPDGVATVAKSVKMVSDGLFYERLSSIPEFFTERLKIPCPDDGKNSVMEKVEAMVDVDFIDVDGIRVEYDDGWVLVRPSGTEPYVRVTAEAKSKKRLEEIVGVGRSWVEKALE